MKEAIRYEIEHHASDLANWARRMERETAQESASVVRIEEWHARAQLAIARLRKLIDQASRDDGQ